MSNVTLQIANSTPFPYHLLSSSRHHSISSFLIKSSSSLSIISYLFPHLQLFIISHLYSSSPPHHQLHLPLPSSYHANMYHFTCTSSHQVYLHNLLITFFISPPSSSSHSSHSTSPLHFQLIHFITSTLSSQSSHHIYHLSSIFIISPTSSTSSHHLYLHNLFITFFISPPSSLSHLHHILHNINFIFIISSSNSSSQLHLQHHHLIYFCNIFFKASALTKCILKHIFRVRCSISILWDVGKSIKLVTDEWVGSRIR